MIYFAINNSGDSVRIVAETAEEALHAMCELQTTGRRDIDAWLGFWGPDMTLQDQAKRLAESGFSLVDTRDGWHI